MAEFTKTSQGARAVLAEIANLFELSESKNFDTMVTRDFMFNGRKYKLRVNLSRFPEYAQFEMIRDYR